MNKDYILKEIDGKMKDAKRLPIMKQLLEKIIVIRKDLDIVFLDFDSILLITVSSIEELHEVRSLLRKIFYRWEDSIKNIWSSCGEGVASYVNKKNKYVKIWLKTSIEDFPILKEGCSFVERKAEKTYTYVCNMEDK
jgi:hypothetical protein